MAAPVVEILGSEEEDDDELGRKQRGRPRLNDKDRVRRRLESRKKYDCRRVYLGEAHGAWVRRRDRGGGDSGGEAWSDARMAAHLLALETGGQGKPDGDLQPNPPRRAMCDDEVSSDDSSSRAAPVIQASEICDETDQPLHASYSESVTDGEEQCTEDSGTVVCVPLGPEAEALFKGVTQEALGQVVTGSCPSQVIIIAGPGYEALAAQGIQLNVKGDGGTCTAFTQTEVKQQDDDSSEEALTEENALYQLQGEDSELADPGEVILGSPLYNSAFLEGSIEPVILESGKYQVENVQPVVKKPERKKNSRSQVTDADSVPDMFHCPYEGCTQVYHALNSFQNHMNLVHRKGRTKVCTEAGCGKKFYLTNHLRRHMIIHTGVREFICETCGKSFKRKSHLEVHRRTHTGETPLQCEVCGFQCRQRASLNWHMKKHESAILYSFSCDQCGKLFEKQESVKFHKLKSHPEGRAT